MDWLNPLHYWARIIPRFFCPKFYGGGDQPAQPNPNLTAAAQFNLNRNTSAFEAQQNRFNQNNPFGSITWRNKGTAANPRWVQNTALSQSQQRIYDNQQGLQRGASGAALRMLPRVAGGLMAQDYNADTDMANAQAQLKRLPTADLATRNWVENSLMQRLNPSLRNDEEALRTRLANQGLQYGTEAYGNAMRDQNQRVNDARLAVVAQGGQEMQRSQDMNLNRIQSLMGAANDRQGANAQSRNQRLAELSAMIQSGGNINLPTYGGATNVSSVGSPDIAGLISSNYQGKVAGANAQTASNNAALAAALQAGGSILGAKYGAK